VGVSAQPGEQAPTLWEAYDAWLRRATSVISDSADALNAMNVFPVPDADTGSNLKLTMTGIAGAVPNLERSTLDDAVQAAVLGAHGNSGAIVAAMFVSVCRALEYDLTRLQSMPPGTVVATLLRLAAGAARLSVARPVVGTILTVADDTASAAEAAARRQADNALAVVQAAQRGAHDSLIRTPDQLEVLASAGVVDAGGQAYVLLIDVLAEILGGAPAQPLQAPASPMPGAQQNTPTMAGEYEVMYALRGASPSDLDALRERLSGLGHSVVIVGDEAVAQVHVHLEEAGAAVEAALPLGELSQIRITALSDRPAVIGRNVLAVVTGSGLAEAVANLGGLPVRVVGDSSVTFNKLRGAAQQTCGELVILPNGPENLKSAQHLATELRRDGRRVDIIPTVSQVQGLAAMAVHEPMADLESAVAAMSTAAMHTRSGAIAVAERAAITMAKPHEPSKIIGTVDHDVVASGSSLAEVAWQVVQRLLGVGGELLTLVRGSDADDALVSDLTARIRDRFPSVDVEVVDGGQPRYPLLLGLE
jgi:uncharacterized protein